MWQFSTVRLRADSEELQWRWRTNLLRLAAARQSFAVLEAVRKLRRQDDASVPQRGPSRSTELPRTSLVTFSCPPPEPARVSPRNGVGIMARSVSNRPGNSALP